MNRQLRLLSMLILLLVCAGQALAENVTFNSRSWNGSTKTLTTTSETQDCILLQGHNDTWEGLGDKTKKTYYAVKGDVMRKTLNIFGEVHLILMDGCKLTCTGGILVTKYNNSKLYIHSQSDGDNQGKMVVTNSYKGAAGIGSGRDAGYGETYIQGGDLNIHGGYAGAGIGSGWHVDSKVGDNFEGTTEVCGGIVYAEGGELGAGIGGGAGDGSVDGVDGGNYRQYAGVVTAKGGELAAGVGGGGSHADILPNYHYSGGRGGTVDIYGGTLTATGGYRGAGIGGGNTTPDKQWSGGLIHVYGGTVNANGGDRAAGIGGGCNGEGPVEGFFYGGTINAIGGKDGAGIGGGEDGAGVTFYILTYEHHGDIIVDGATVRAEGRGGAAGLGGGIRGYGRSYLTGQYNQDYEYGRFIFKKGSLKLIAGSDCDASDPTGGSALGHGKGFGKKDADYFAGHLVLSDYCWVKAGNKESEIGSWDEQKFTAAERKPACRWRNVVLIEDCTHPDIVYTYFDEEYHNAICKYCNSHNLRERHDFGSLDNPHDCKCGKKYNDETDSWSITLHTSTDGKTYNMTETRKALRGQTILLVSPGSLKGMTFEGWMEKGATEPSDIEKRDYDACLARFAFVTSSDAKDYYARYRYEYVPEWSWSADIKTATLKITNPLVPEDTRSFYSIACQKVPEECTVPTGNEMGIDVYQAKVSYKKAEGLTYEFTDKQQLEYYNVPSIVIDALADNSETLEMYNDRLVSVTMQNMTLKKDGQLHPVSLPFSVKIADSPFAGAKVYGLSAANIVDGQLQMTFQPVTDYMVAGEPYFVKWDSGADVENPDFTGIYIKNEELSVQNQYYELCSTFDILSVEEKDRERTLVLENNELRESSGLVGAFTNCLYVPALVNAKGETVVTSVRMDFGNELSVTHRFAYNLSGEGTEQSPYLIRSTDDWNLLSDNVSNGNRYMGKYFRLTKDIRVSTMVGTDDYSFKGSFNGDGHELIFTIGTEAKPFTGDFCAPFRYYDGNSIKLLTVSGDIYTSGQYAGGLIGLLTNSADIHACHSGVNIHSSVNGTANHGGFVGYKSGYTYTVNFTNCLFDGKLLGTNTKDCGGFLGKARIGSENNCLANFKGCMFAPAEIEWGNTANFSYSEPQSIVNCYYMQTKGDGKQGVKGYVFDRAISGFGSSVMSNFMTVYEKAIQYQGTYYSSIVPLYEGSSENSKLLSTLGGHTVDVCLLGRRLYKDDSWNTLYLPFDVTVGTNGVLSGATARELTDASISGTELTARFGKSVTTLLCGRPYVVKWPEGTDLVDPVFEGVTIYNAGDHSFDNGQTGAGHVRFAGSYDNRTFTEADSKRCLSITATNSLAYVPAGKETGACRVFFYVGDENNVPQLSAFNLDFSDATGVITPLAPWKEDEAWYTLDGCQLNGKPTQKGIYIHNGNKVVIK